VVWVAPKDSCLKVRIYLRHRLSPNRFSTAFFAKTMDHVTVFIHVICNNIFRLPLGLKSYASNIMRMNLCSMYVFLPVVQADFLSLPPTRRHLFLSAAACLRVMLAFMGSSSSSFFNHHRCKRTRRDWWRNEQILLLSSLTNEFDFQIIGPSDRNLIRVCPACTASPQDYEKHIQ